MRTATAAAILLISLAGCGTHRKTASTEGFRAETTAMTHHDSTSLRYDQRTVSDSETGYTRLDLLLSRPDTAGRQHLRRVSLLRRDSRTATRQQSAVRTESRQQSTARTATEQEHKESSRQSERHGFPYTAALIALPLLILLILKLKS